MSNSFERKYRRVLEILPDVTAAANGHLVLVGGTALALFYLKHRISIDLDFVPLHGDGVSEQASLKGALTKLGYRTSRGVYSNQFIIQFEDTSIKVEVFTPDSIPKHIERHAVGRHFLPVASLDDLLKMKEQAYADRREARDLFDLYHIFKKKGVDSSKLCRLLRSSGSPLHLDELPLILLSPLDFNEFKKVIDSCSPAK
jgi:predicted nucleotidyltransferase component of viral defense system